ncbi:serine/threonine-protein kinase [Mycobacterium sp.]|uniref:serine/threonine-protein kinase n=1 Tax=Mycobacterium sp. TaxID=1785 RepID=UPI00126FC51F|nr:serine/threonine-protein kinase [Mycobacterium sp.]KAA8964267.1 MAG: serine/threonine protein kinase [Mycobacterium sp.]
MVLPPGTIFAGYSIIRMLGTTGSGEVYLASHPTLRRDDALKVLPRAMTADPGFCARFTGESEAVTTLYHPNILQTYQRGEFDGQLWIAMEYVQGRTVAQLMAEEFPAGMPTTQALAIVSAVSGALEYAHRRGVLHRDVKPANIFLSEEGGQRILLTDFGVGRPLDEAGRRTATNVTGATVAYAAPEVLRGFGVDGRADQYALAATAFHLLAGSPPYQDCDPATVIGHHLGAAAPKLGDRHPELGRLDRVLSKALAKDPHDRFASCQEFAEALSAQAWSLDPRPQAYPGLLDYPDQAAPQAGAGTPAKTGSRSASTTEVWHKRPVLVLGLVAGAMLFLLAGVFLGVVVGHRGGDKSTPGADATVRSAAAGTTPRPSAAAPVPSVAARPGPGELLDGVYQLDMNRAQETYNDNYNPQPPNVTTWWAFRSSCDPTGCVADGIEVDSKNHLAARPSAQPVVLDFRNGAWQSRPVTVPFACIGQNGKSAEQTTKQVLTLQPHGNGPLRGDMTINVESNECGQQGATIVIPAVAGRTGGVPPGVTVPAPPPATTPTR